MVFCFDGDEAGKKAAWKALELALPNMVGTRSVRFLFLDQGEDPDSTVRKEGVDGFKARVKQSMTLSDFLFKGLIGRLGLPLSSAEGQQQLIALAKPYIVSAPDAHAGFADQILSELCGNAGMASGAGDGDSVSSTAKKAPKQPEKPVNLKATSVVLKLIRLLLARRRGAACFRGFDCGFEALR